jgi:hypothetical protein
MQKYYLLSFFFKILSLIFFSPFQSYIVIQNGGPVFRHFVVYISTSLYLSRNSIGGKRKPFPFRNTAQVANIVPMDNFRYVG